MPRIAGPRHDAVIVRSHVTIAAAMDLAPFAVGIGLVVALWLAFLIALSIHRPSRDQVGQMLRFAPDLARLAYSVLRDPATPRSVKVVLGMLIAYLASPIDLVPDLVPVVGSLDDVVVGAIALRWVGRRIGVETLRAHRSGSAEGWSLIARVL
jgi:uncharacterized membrane protein YkvA (DUF1232 family)